MNIVKLRSQISGKSVDELFDYQSLEKINQSFTIENSRSFYKNNEYLESKQLDLNETFNPILFGNEYLFSVEKTSNNEQKYYFVSKSNFPSLKLSYHNYRLNPNAKDRESPTWISLYNFNYDINEIKDKNIMDQRRKKNKNYFMKNKKSCYELNIGDVIKLGRISLIITKIHLQKIKKINNEGNNDNNLNKQLNDKNKNNNNKVIKDIYQEYHYKADDIRLEPIEDNALVELIQSYIRNLGKHEALTDSDVINMIDTLKEVDPGVCRPLFAMFIADAWVDGSINLQNWDRDSAVKYIANKEIDRFDTIISNYSNTTSEKKQFRVALYSAVAYATFVGELDADDLLNEQDMNIAITDQIFKQMLVDSELIKNKTVKGVEPDLVGEYICISILDRLEMENVSAFFSKLYENHFMDMIAYFDKIYDENYEQASFDEYAYLHTF